MTTIAPETFDLTHLDITVDCDVITCDHTAAWAIHWKTTYQTPCECRPIEPVCGIHLQVLLKARDNNFRAICPHGIVIGLIRDLIDRIEPL